jgi:MFS superfamily sulfate permease-like transporter
VGIVLGLGMGFMLDGIRMMATDWLIGSIGLAGTLLLLTSRKVPAMFVLLVFGALAGAIGNPEALRGLSTLSMGFRVPEFALATLTWHDFAIGAVFLALPQLPLTLGNAVIAIREENNRLFPDRPVTERTVATSTGVMNLAGAALGGVPMCHGAGGMAGHVAFGARTGGALVILGTILLGIAFFFSGSVETIFRLFSSAVLGVILFLTGAQLALGSCELGRDTGERFVTLVTAAFAVWNVGMAFVVGMAGIWLARRGWLRL